MIDMHWMRTHPQEFLALCRKKDPDYDAQRLIDLDELVRTLTVAAEALRARRNSLAKSVGPGGIVPATVRQEAKQLGEQLAAQEQELREREQEFRTHYLWCPNLLLADVPEGGKDQNRTVRSWSDKPVFPFPVEHHVALNEKNHWFDMAAAARMAASHFVAYQGVGAHIVYALALYMMRHNEEHGYHLIIPPYVVNGTALEGASNLPRFRDAVYEVPADGLYLTPTAEVNLTNLHRDHTFELIDLPVRLTAWTSCFRREAGTYGASERGLIRIHQFEKVELYTICAPEQSADEQDRMIACAEAILQKLGLHYRVSLLAAQDCSFASSKTYDIEVWMPGQGEYKEVSSASRCDTFQARRCNMRYRPEPHAKTQFVHTLNSSSLALPRLMVAIMETYQQEDGSITIPDVLRRVVWNVGV